MKKRIYSLQLVLGVFLIVIGIYFFTEEVNNIVNALFAWSLAVRILISLVLLLRSKKTKVEVIIQMIVDFVMFIILVLYGYATFGHSVIEVGNNSWLKVQKLLGYWLVATAIEIIIILIMASGKLSKDKVAYYAMSCLVCFLLAFFLIVGDVIGLKFIDERFLSYLVGVLSICFGVLFIINILKIGLSNKIKQKTVVQHYHINNANEGEKTKKQTKTNKDERATSAGKSLEVKKDDNDDVDFKVEE